MPLTHSEYLKIRHFPALDGLRAVAALMVVFFHYGGPDRLQGWIGVQMFFVLSGFLITTLMLREEDRTGKVSLRRFYTRRAFRILPVYFLLLGLTAVIWVVMEKYQRSGLADAMGYYLVFFNEFVGASPYGQSWSLGIEQKFYLVWPLLAFTIGAASVRRRLSIALGGMALALVLTPATLGASGAGWPVHYFSILAGCVVAIAMHHPRGFAFVRPLTRPAVGICVAGAFLAVHLTLKPTGHFLGDVFALPGYVTEIPVYAVAVAVLLPVLIAPGPVQRTLSMRWLVFLGERSYSLYLVQAIAALTATLALPKMSGISQAVTVTAIAVMMACVLYRCVEVPMINLGRYLLAPERKPQRAPVPVP
ncbi:MAG TPA: acyltransferase [Pseudonocardiaceae bacterium]|jgi:peptidoglycan/LPS O-acetylase OafA/YrhL|nr:acyltransferase [Pseudonocardiaceae bacterium]